jgi:hypothetical protein
MQRISSPPTGKPWREFYVAAVFETNAAELPGRIADAEKALALRARELFQTTGDHTGRRTRHGRSHVHQACREKLKVRAR